MRLFFNEYYRRKPMRLCEKDGEMFCMEKGGEYDYEFISIDEYEQELAKLKAENEKLRREVAELKKKTEDKKLEDQSCEATKRLGW